MAAPPKLYKSSVTDDVEAGGRRLSPEAGEAERRQKKKATTSPKPPQRPPGHPSLLFVTIFHALHTNQFPEMVQVR